MHKSNNNNNKINFCKNVKFAQIKFKRKKREARFLSGPEQRRMANERHRTDSCIVHFLATETFRDRFVSFSLQKEHSFLTKTSERTLNKPVGLRSRRRFLIFVLQIQIYGLCLPITLKKNKTKQNKKRNEWDDLHHCSKQISPVSCENSSPQLRFNIWGLTLWHVALHVHSFSHSNCKIFLIVLLQFTYHPYYEQRQLIFLLIFNPSPFCPEGLLNLKP